MLNQGGAGAKPRQATQAPKLPSRLLRLQQNSLTRGQCEKRTPNTDRLGNRGTFESGDYLPALYGSLAFQLAFGEEERDPSYVSELLYSDRDLFALGREEAL